METLQSISDKKAKTPAPVEKEEPEPEKEPSKIPSFNDYRKKKDLEAQPETPETPEDSEEDEEDI